MNLSKLLGINLERSSVLHMHMHGAELISIVPEIFHPIKDARNKRGHVVQWLSNRLLRLIRQAQGRSPTILDPEMDWADSG